MKQKSPPSSTPRPRPGATLIEVVAGLVVLGVLITSVTVARGRLARQWADADRRLAASRALDAMVGKWLDGPTDSIPVSAGGHLEGVPGCTWRTTTSADAASRELGAAVVRVEVFEGRRAILALELLKRVEPRRPDQPAPEVAP